MRIQFLAAPAPPFPASRSAIRFRFQSSDFVWALISPLLALYLSDAYIVHGSDYEGLVVRYCLTSFAASVVALVIFKVQDGVARYFSVYDALSIGKAVVLTEILSSLALFVENRLEGIPRSAPIIHGLVLGAGLVFVRTLMRVAADGHVAKYRDDGTRDYVLLVGANSFSSFYIKLSQTCSSSRRDIVAVLDERREMFGRAIDGVPVIGAPEHLDAIVEEYAVHGIDIGRVVIAGDANALSTTQMSEITRVCEKRLITLEVMAHLLGLRQDKMPIRKVHFRISDRSEKVPSRYLHWKRAIDFCLASAMIIILLPLLVGAGALVLLDLGIPVLFWQQRLGLRGSSFLLYKFRTLRPPFDWRGRPIPTDKRLSRIGEMLRKTSIDELPQLLNVLVGEMSLIGPRPLLPEDQPAGASVRLMVRPGITGWAQVHGGKLLTPVDKDKLDEWYVQNASIWIDLRILLMTAKIVLLGARSNETTADLNEIETRLSGRRDKRRST